MEGGDEEDLDRLEKLLEKEQNDEAEVVPGGTLAGLIDTKSAAKPAAVPSSPDKPLSKKVGIKLPRFKM